MKKCRDIEKILPLYLDDSLSGADKQTVEEHLKTCPHCPKTLVELSKTQALVNNLGRVEPPPRFKQKIMDSVREEAGKESFVRKLFYPLRIKIPVQIMATIVIAVLAVYIYRSGDKQMKAVLPSFEPAPIVETRKNPLPEQKIKKSADEAVQKEEVIQKREAPRERIAAAVDAAKNENKQVVAGMRDDQYASAPAAESISLSGARLEKKKENKISGVAMKDGRAPLVQSSMIGSTVLLRVADINTAVGEVDKLLIKYAAKNITRQAAPDKTILVAELKNQKIKALMTQLKKIGQVEEVDVPVDNAETNISLVIKIVNN